MQLKWDDRGLKTPLTRARGLGAAHAGVHHWIVERVTAAIAVVLCLWLAWACIDMRDWSYDHVAAWMAQPLNAAAMILTILTVFYHTALGVQVVLEDYVHGEFAKFVTVWLNHFLFFAAGLLSILSVLKIAFVK